MCPEFLACLREIARDMFCLDACMFAYQVEEEDVEKMNVPSMDRAENVALLPFLNESSVLHVFRQRYGSNLVHTFAGKRCSFSLSLH